MIRHLAEDVCARIRTGVAMTSFAQAVEELILNSVDAGATSIAIRVDLPYFKIQVVDNGVGITQHQFSLVGERYATSKCHTVEDLNNLRYFGYRGEALASLRTAASFLEITSRCRCSNITYSKCFQNGEVLDVTESCLPRPSAGTTVTAYNLLYNLPVRRKCLNTGLEMEKIRYRVAGIALVWPHISISLRDDSVGHVILQTHKCSGMLAAFSNIFTPARSRGLMEISAERDEFKLYGIVSKESYSRKDLQFVFVNKRIVLKSSIHSQVNKILGRSIILRRKGLGSDVLEKLGNNLSPMKQSERNGIFAINVECPFSAYDITFDPAKTLVEFHNWPKLIHLLQDMLYGFLRRENLILIPDPSSTSPSLSNQNDNFGDDKINEEDDDDDDRGCERKEIFESTNISSSNNQKNCSNMSLQISLSENYRTSISSAIENGLFSKHVSRPMLQNAENLDDSKKPRSALVTGLSLIGKFSDSGKASSDSSNKVLVFSEDQKQVSGLTKKPGTSQEFSKDERRLQSKKRCLEQEDGLRSKVCRHETNCATVQDRKSDCNTLLGSNGSPLLPLATDSTAKTKPTKKKTEITLGNSVPYCSTLKILRDINQVKSTSEVITHTLQDLRQSTQKVVQAMGDLYKTPDSTAQRTNQDDGHPCPSKLPKVGKIFDVTHESALTHSSLASSSRAASQPGSLGKGEVNLAGASKSECQPLSVYIATTEPRVPGQNDRGQNQSEQVLDHRYAGQKLSQAAKLAKLMRGNKIMDPGQVDEDRLRHAQVLQAFSFHRSSKSVHPEETRSKKDLPDNVASVSQNLYISREHQSQVHSASQYGTLSHTKSSDCEENDNRVSSKCNDIWKCRKCASPAQACVSNCPLNPSGDALPFSMYKSPVDQEHQLLSETDSSPKVSVILSLPLEPCKPTAMAGQNSCVLWPVWPKSCKKSFKPDSNHDQQKDLTSSQCPSFTAEDRYLDSPVPTLTNPECVSPKDDVPTFSSLSYKTEESVSQGFSPTLGGTDIQSSNSLLSSAEMMTIDCGHSGYDSEGFSPASTHTEYTLADVFEVSSSNIQKAISQIKCAHGQCVTSKGKTDSSLDSDSGSFIIKPLKPEVHSFQGVATQVQSMEGQINQVISSVNEHNQNKTKVGYIDPMPESSIHVVAKAMSFDNRSWFLPHLCTSQNNTEPQVLAYDSMNKQLGINTVPETEDFDDTQNDKDGPVFKIDPVFCDGDSSEDNLKNIQHKTEIEHVIFNAKQISQNMCISNPVTDRSLLVDKKMASTVSGTDADYNFSADRVVLQEKNLLQLEQVSDSFLSDDDSLRKKFFGSSVNSDIALNNKNECSVVSSWGHQSLSCDQIVAESKEADSCLLRNVKQANGKTESVHRTDGDNSGTESLFEYSAIISTAPATTCLFSSQETIQVSGQSQRGLSVVSAIAGRADVTEGEPMFTLNGLSKIQCLEQTADGRESGETDSLRSQHKQSDLMSSSGDHVLLMVDHSIMVRPNKFSVMNDAAPDGIYYEVNALTSQTTSNHQLLPEREASVRLAVLSTDSVTRSTVQLQNSISPKSLVSCECVSDLEHVLPAGQNFLHNISITCPTSQVIVVNEPENSTSTGKTRDVQACWQEITDAETDLKTYISNMSGHTVTEQQWSALSSQAQREMLAANGNTPEASARKSPVTLSTSCKQALEKIVKQHFELEEAEAVSKWRGGRQPVYSPVAPIEKGLEDLEAGVDISSIIAKWNNPVLVNYREPTLVAQVCPSSLVAKSCFSSLAQVELTKDMLINVKVIGQVDKKFIACVIEKPDELLKESYEVQDGVRTDFIKRSAMVQLLTLDQDDLRIMKAFSKEFDRIGISFTVDKSSRTQVQINSVPTCIAEKDGPNRTGGITESVQHLIKEHIDLLKSTNGACGRLPLTIHKILCSQACHGAVKFGDQLTLQECQDLLSSLATCNLPFQCAHGRPSVAPLVNLTALEKELISVPKHPNLWKISQHFNH